MQPKPFVDFVGTNQSLRYLHEFVHQFPNVFEKAVGHLPQGAFRESIETSSSSSTPCASARRKRLQSIKQDNISMLQKYLNMEKREEAPANQSAACLDYRLMMHRNALDKAEDRRMELFREARKRKKLSHGAVNLRFEKHLRCVEKAIKTGVHPEPKMGDGSDDSSVDSLDSIFVQIHQQDDNIEESQRRLLKARQDAKPLL